MASSTFSSSSVFEQAATLNNEGVMALMEHRAQCAIVSLTDSIRLMKSELSKPTLDFSFFHNDGTVVELPTNMVEIPPPPSQGKQQPVNFEDDTEQAFFNHAIIIPLSPFNEDAPMPSDLDLHIYSAAVVFNLALAHQQLSMKHKLDRTCLNGSLGDSCSIGPVTPCLYTANRNKAEKLYTVILKLLQDSACSQVRAGVVVKLAAIHNLHWIQYQKREETGSSSNNNIDNGATDDHSLQQTLARFIQGIRQHDPTLVRTFLENDAQIQGLLMNVLWLKDQQAPPKIAPAA
jgi:hypothetical protein